MKISQLILGLAIGFGSCLLISADVENQPVEDAPRYHLISVGGSAVYYAYDAVTGEYKEVFNRDMRKNSNIKELLAE